MTRSFTLSQILDTLGAASAVVSLVVAFLLRRWWTDVQAKGVQALYDSLVSSLVGSGAEQVSARFGRWRELVRRELAACSTCVLLVSPGKGQEADAIERVLRRSFARVVSDDANVPPGTPVVVVGEERCYVELLNTRRCDLPLILACGHARLDMARLNASERAAVAANSSVTAAVWARAAAAACIE